MDRVQVESFMQRTGVPDLFLSQPDAARVIGCSTRTLIRYIRAGALVVDGYVGRHPRIRYTSLVNFVKHFPAFSYYQKSHGKKGHATQNAVQN